MKKTLLATLLENKTFQVNERQFKAKAEANPFSKMVADPKDIEAEYGEDDTDGMDDYVRRDSANRGLDTVARAFVGPQSGVNASRFHDMVHKDDHKDDQKDSSAGHPGTFNDGNRDLDDDEDALYLTTRDLSYYKNEFNQDGDADEVELDTGKEFMKTLNASSDPQNGEVAGDVEFATFDKLGDEEGEEELEDDEFSDLDPDMPTEDDRFEGVVRSVKGAYLVSKKRQPDETYTEVWMYNIGDEFEDEANIRKAILAGTDIDPSKSFSEDGTQESVIKSVGNVQYLTIGGIQD